jgi:hypothetical protein
VPVADIYAFLDNPDPLLRYFTRFSLPAKALRMAFRALYGVENGGNFRALVPSPCGLSTEIRAWCTAKKSTATNTINKGSFSLASLLV